MVNFGEKFENFNWVSFSTKNIWCFMMLDDVLARKQGFLGDKNVVLP